MVRRNPHTLLALLAACLLAACAAAPLPVSEGDIAFGLMGDTPYSQSEVRRLDDMIDAINRQDLAFVVHVGDITSGAGPCSDEWFLARKAQFGRIRHPFILIPGDNDWTDCHRSGMDPMERLVRFRELFAAGDDSLGVRRMKLERQSADVADGRFTEYREHMRWVTGNVQFVTLNIQGSNNNLGRNKAMEVEYERRMAAAFEWLDQAVKLAELEQRSALVIIMHANPNLEERRPRAGTLDGFASLRGVLRAHALWLKRPVLLVHGDTHRYQQNQPLKNREGRTIENFTRVEVDGSPFVSWLRGLIRPNAADAREPPLYVAPAAGLY